MFEAYSIRKFEAGDLPRLHAIREAAYRPVFQSFRSIVGDAIAPIAFAAAEREQADYLDTICGPQSNRDLYVVSDGPAIIAFFAVGLNQESKIGEIDLNAVDPAHQGGGVGSWMYEYALDLMRKAGMVVATVGTGGDASHAPARRAYEKVGFGPVIPSVHYYKLL